MKHKLRLNPLGFKHLRELRTIFNCYNFLEFSDRKPDPRVCIGPSSWHRRGPCERLQAGNNPRTHNPNAWGL